MTTNTATDPKPKTVADLMAVTSLGRDLVRRSIVEGSLPGYRVGTRYVVPAKAFEDFCHGRWVPITTPVIVEVRNVTPIDPSEFVRRRGEQAKTA